MKGRKELKEREVHKELKVSWVLWERLVLKELWDHRVPVAFLGHQEIKVLRVKKVTKGLLV